MSRAILRVIYDAAGDRWQVEVDGIEMASFHQRHDALDEGWHRGSVLSAQNRQATLVVHAKDGSIEGEFPYQLGDRPLSN